MNKQSLISTLLNSIIIFSFVICIGLFIYSTFFLDSYDKKPPASNMTTNLFNTIEGTPLILNNFKKKLF